MIFSNFGIWTFDNLIFWDVENIMFWMYMFVILVGQALVFLLVRGGGAEPSLPEKKRMSCTGELNKPLFYCGLLFVVRKRSMYLYSLYSTG